VLKPTRHKIKSRRSDSFVFEAIDVPFFFAVIAKENTEKNLFNIRSLKIITSDKII